MRWGASRLVIRRGLGTSSLVKFTLMTGNGRPSRFPFIEQCHLHAVGLGLHRVQEHTGYLLPVDVSLLGGVTAAFVGGWEYLVPGAAGRLVLGNAAKSRRIPS